MASKITAPKGTKDILPEEIYLWEKVENTAKKVCERYQYKQIRTPEFENVSLFQRGIGDTTDVVQKEMYTFSRNQKEIFALKPEGTAGVVRAFNEHSMLSRPLPIKLFYLTSCYRCENPQKGRQRQFHQFGIEVLGSKSPITDAEVIGLGFDFIREIGIRNITLKINSVGCSNCRNAYYTKLRTFLEPHVEELCDVCKSRLEKNPMRVLDCKNEKCQQITKDAPLMVEHLCEDCKSHYGSVKAYLTIAGIPFQEDPTIVRGLDYYTNTAFEFISSDLGAQSALGGGGRYNQLVEMVGGSDVPGIGFAMGLERLLLILKEQGITEEKIDTVDIYIAPLGEPAHAKAFKDVQALRQMGFLAEMDCMQRSLKGQMKYANKLNARYVAILGEEELEKEKYLLRDMQTKAQQEIDFDSLVNLIKSNGGLE